MTRALRLHVQWVTRKGEGALGAVDAEALTSRHLWPERTGNLEVRRIVQLLLVMIKTQTLG